MAQAFPAGHRIRLGISTSYWPLAWPPPEPVRLTVIAGASELVLPTRPVAEPDEVSLTPFDEPEATPPITTTQLHPGAQRWQVSRDLIDYRSTLDVVKDLGVVRFDDIGLDVTRSAHERYESVRDDFDSPRGEIDWEMGFSRGDWDVRTTTRTVLTCTPTEFRLHAQLDAYECGQRVFSRNWHETIPRDHV
jgi:hypothetical protein